MESRPPTTATIVTINTAKCNAPYRDRIAAIGAEIERLRPDVVACQEVFCSADGEVGTARLLARIPGYRVVAHKARPKLRYFEGMACPSTSGMAILARQPIEQVVRVPLPSPAADGERIAQVAILRWPTGAVLAVANVHLTHLPDSADMRRVQIASVLRVLEAHPGALPCLVAGDFNAGVDAPELSQWVGRRVPGGLIDAFIQGGGSVNATTLVSSQRRIDHILAVSGRHEWAFRDARIVLNDAVHGVYPSDHFGVMVAAVFGKST